MGLVPRGLSALDPTGGVREPESMEGRQGQAGYGPCPDLTESYRRLEEAYQRLCHAAAAGPPTPEDRTRALEDRTRFIEEVRIFRQAAHELVAALHRKTFDLSIDRYTIGGPVS